MMEQASGQNFGEILRGYRVKKGRTQKQIADFSTISIRAIRDLEQGRARRPRRATVELLADALSLDEKDRSVLAAVADHSACADRSRTEDGTLVAPPVPCHPLMSRDREVELLVQVLTTPGRRILSVTGAPGVGKSRLSLEVASRVHRLARVPVLWASQTEQDCVIPGSYRPGELSGTLLDVSRELFGEEGREAPGALEVLVRAVEDRPALLLLEIPRGGAPNPDLFGRLLAACPELRVLAVGRRPLGLMGERVFPLQPLDAEHASRMLLAHTGNVSGESEGPGLGDSDPTRICRLLDGLPGAIVAVSSWLAVYDHDSLITYLNEDPHAFLVPLPGTAPGGLGCALSEALDDCSKAERALLDLLCATPDGESAGGLAQVAGLSPAQSGRALNDLLIQGLVRRDTAAGPMRFRALNLVRALNSVGGHHRIPVSAGEAVVRV